MAPKQIGIQKVWIDGQNQLGVQPDDMVWDEMQFVYRDASGVRWDPELHALVAYEPDRWEHFDLFCGIHSAVASEFGMNLFINTDTQWDGVPDDLKQRITTWPLRPSAS